MTADRIEPSALPSTLSVGELLAGYRSGRFTVAKVLGHVLERIAEAPERHVWISLLDRARVHQYVQALESKSPDSLPLYGIPFAIKDNIDLAGVLTTAACPDYAYMPEKSAHVVQRLIDAGAIPIGKTNLDQFATGLVGTRSPYGQCRNSRESGVRLGRFQLGIGRRGGGGPRQFFARYGHGRLGASACRLQQHHRAQAHVRSAQHFGRGACVPLHRLRFDFRVDRGRRRAVCAVAEGYDRTDAYSREPEPLRTADMRSFRFGIPRADELEFFDDVDYSRLSSTASSGLEQLGGQCVEIDFSPFRTAARLLYDGAWIAERFDAVGEFIERNPDAVHPDHAPAHPREQVAVGCGRVPQLSPARRCEAARRAKREGDIDLLVTPTAGTIYRIAEIEWEPIRLNSNLGFYTNFVNFLDLAAVAVPAGFREDGLPFGVTLVGSAWSDEAASRLADRFHRASVEHAGALGRVARSRCPAGIACAGRGTVGAQGAALARAREGFIDVAVCGAHMEGLPLNHQLSSRGATFVRRSRTVPSYRFYALPGGPPFRPGLVRVPTGGASVDVEVWSVPEEHFGSFVAGIPAPLGIGRIDLEDGQQVSGFLCEAHAVEGARDITALGGWRQYINAR